MARIPLVFSGWAYDDQTKRIVATFSDAPPADHEDPAAFVSSLSLEVEMLPRRIDEAEVEQPEQTQINQLNNVVDQLVMDVLMGGL